VTVESGAATTAASVLDQPAPDTPDQAGEFIQLLTPEGERIDHPDYPLDLSTEAIRGMYRDLVLVRAIDTVAISLQRQGELGIWASLLGQEAAQIGRQPRRLGARGVQVPPVHDRDRRSDAARHRLRDGHPA